MRPMITCPVHAGIKRTQLNTAKKNFEKVLSDICDLSRLHLVIERAVNKGVTRIIKKEIGKS